MPRPVAVATPTQSASNASVAGSALFLAVFLFFWVTSSPYVDLAALEAAGGTTQSPNVVNQVLVLTLTGLMFAFAAQSPLRASLGRPRLLLAVMFAWFFISSALAPHAADALKKTALALLTIANASIFLALPQSDRHFAKLLLIGSCIMLAFAYFGVVFLPLRAIHQTAEITEPMNAGMWRGQFTHKNVASAVMLVAVFFAIFIHGAGYRKGGIAVGVLSIVFLLHTGGKSSTAMLPAILILAWIFERWTWTRIPIVFGGIAAFNLVALGAASSSTFVDFIKALGIDPTFTNRSDIWRLAFGAIGRSPIVGYGFQGFWQTPELASNPARIETWAVLAFNGHNAYIDTLLTTGFPGLILTLAFLLVVPFMAANAAYTTANNRAVTRLFLRIWLFGIYASCLESNFFQSGSPVWFAMLFSIFGLRMQGLARLKTDYPDKRLAVPHHV
jgi:O-antigen ligase